MLRNSEGGLVLEEKLAELRRVVAENQNRGEWELAVLGTGVIRAVEQSRASAMEMRQRADDFSRTFEDMLRNRAAAASR